MRVRLLTLCLMLVVPFGWLNAQQKDNPAVLRAAESGISAMIRDIPASMLPDYGFRNREETARIRFADPLPVYTLKDSAMVFTDTWRVPVVIDTRYRSLLTVVRENGLFKAVDFGATGLAQVIEANRKPETIGLLRVYELRTDYLIQQPTAGEPRLTQLEFNR